MAFPYTRQPLEMLLLYDMVGFPPIYLLTVHVVQPSLSIILCLVQREDFHQFAITDEVRDLTADLLTEVCHNVEVEHHLQPLSTKTFHYKTANVQDGACLDISVNGFWGGRFEKCYTDSYQSIFNPLAASNSGSNLQLTYRKHESLKKRAYKSRLR